jgi:hypothetical protein
MGSKEFKERRQMLTYCNAEIVNSAQLLKELRVDVVVVVGKKKVEHVGKAGSSAYVHQVSTPRNSPSRFGH